MSATCDHDETAHRHVICCLLALEIADYDARPILDQIRLTHDFHNLLFDATARITTHDLVSMVGEDGALLGFLADPKECFTTALTIRDATLMHGRYPDLPLRIGVNLGQAQIAEDEFGKQYVSGEGRQDADRLMHQGPPRQISVARQFVELLSRTAPELAAPLEYQGPNSDTVGAQLCLYRLPPPQDPGSQKVPDQPATNAVDSRVIYSPTRSGPALTTLTAQSPTESRHWARRSWLGYAIVTLLVGAGMVTLSSRLSVEIPILGPAEQDAPAPSRTPVPEAAQTSFAPVLPQNMTPWAGTTPPVLANVPGTRQPAASMRAKPTAGVAPAARRIKENETSSLNTVAAWKERLEPERTVGASVPIEDQSIQGPGSPAVFLAVKPWGEVYVDGRKIGVSPPLKRFALAPGAHLITITNSSFPSYQTQLVADPGAQTTVAHDFECRSDRAMTCREGFGKGLDLQSRSRLGMVEPRR